MNERERFALIERLFHELVELDADARERRLAALAQDDPGLHDALVGLFAEPGALTARERALDGLVEHARVLAGSEPVLPERVGPYRIVRLLGEGGMGRVYEAEQEEPVRRRVALKLTRGGLDPDRIIARFHAERQALAVLDHPNIARVFDAGSTPEGRPWFAMELVEGEPITRWAQRRRLSLKQRIELLLPVCDAVQHAHRKGVIHRDLKPSNLLVVESDGVGVPKIIDFGIAKAIEAPLLAQSSATRFGELVGTPEYMSPEQAALGAVDIDTRSDVYALGLVLYELLVGELPMSVEQVRRYAFDELCRRIREDDTPRPSARLASVSQDTRASMASGDWARRLRGDLDSVVLKALAKDREQRYGTAAALADDLRRFLDDQPVLATAPSLRYRIGKFVRRNAIASVAAVAVVLALAIGTVVASLGLLEARRAEARARAAQQTAEATTDFMVRLFESADPRSEPGPPPTARDLLERGAGRIDALDLEPPVQARLLEVLGDASWALGEYQRAAPLIDRAIALRQAGPAADPLRLAFLLDRRGGLERDRAELDRAEASHRQALAVLDAAGLGASADAGRVLNNLGIVLRRGNRLNEAVAVYDRALALAVALEPQPSRNAASARTNLAAVHQSRGDFAASRDTTRVALAEFTALLPADHPFFGTLHSNIALSSRSLGDLGAALRHSRAAIAHEDAALPGGHPDRAETLHGLAAVLLRLGRLDEARAALLEAQRLLVAALGPDHGRIAVIADSLAEADLLAGDPGAAAAGFRAVLARLDGATQPAAQRHRIGIGRKLATSLRRLGQAEAARAAARDTGAQARALARPDDEARALLLEALVDLDVGDRSGAEALWRQALALVPDCAAPAGTGGDGADPARPCPLDQAINQVTRAHVLAGLGEGTAAFAALSTSIAGPGWTVGLLDHPDLAPLRGDPRWAGAEQQMAARIAAADLPD
jgi:non-specific serine/threonine protein kinase/serine/threonine-protein kinase